MMVRDVYIYETTDGGDIVVSGTAYGGDDIDVTLDDSIYSTVYLALFCSNYYDDTTAADDLMQWWGNEDEAEEGRFRSLFCHMFDGHPITSESLRALRAAAERDLSVALGDDAESIEVALRAVSASSLEMELTVQLPENDVRFFAFEVSR